MTRCDCGRYYDEEACHWCNRTLSADDQPQAPMKIVTKCERVQPTVAGLDARGNFVWEGREMPRWQMEMFRIARDIFNFISRNEWGSRWYEVAKYETEMRDADDADKAHFHYKAATPERLQELRRMYPATGRPFAYRKTGD